ncbi:MAG: hypothetical protein JWO88_172 [Frankiales bacterium]|nr:hypothetical protein [Frankiales bacterium]
MASESTTAMRDQERLARLGSKMAHNVQFELQQAARRRTERFGSALGVVASLVAIYDLSLLTLH